MLTATGLLILAVAGGTLWRLRGRALPPPTVVQLSSERWAGAGSFSPDGTQIAYASAGDEGANWDIWIKIVGQEEARRLTTDPAPEGTPAWSPDGTQIAFLRHHAGLSGNRLFTDFGVAGVYLVSPVGGPERRLSDFPAGSQLSWSRDGRWLAAARGRSETEPPGGIYLISVANGELRAVTSPKASTFDVSPSFSPDGRTLAYAACEGVEGLPVCDVYRLALDSELKPVGVARRLTHQGLLNMGLAWARDGRSIIYAGGAPGHLWRVRANGGTPPERLELAASAARPCTVGSRDRLAFLRYDGHRAIYRLQLGGSPTALIESAVGEFNPQYSPDGRKIAFESPRAGHQIWLADADGSNTTQLTRGPGRSQGTPRWSPDGRSIVFDSQAEDGNADIWTIGVDGSGLRQITHSAASDVVPMWSRDGRFICFTSNRTGRFEIWRVPAGGGAEEQLTRKGGSFPVESFDGKTLYYQRSFGASALISLSTAGGEEHQVLPCVVSDGYTSAPRGIVHLTCSSPDTANARGDSLLYWDASTGRDQPITALGADTVDGLSVSPDGRSIVYGRGRAASDLMMIENFR